MTVFSTRTAQLSLLPLAASLLMACGGSSGGSNDDSGQQTGDSDNPVRAAVAGAAALSFAQSGISTSREAEDGNTAKATEHVDCDSGSQSITDDTGAGPSGGLASPYHSGDFARTVISADECRNSASGEGFSFESYTDGMMQTGEAENGRVLYMLASDQDGNYYNDFVMEFSGSAFNGEQATRMGGIMHLCDGCATPQHGHDMEMRAFMRLSATFDQSEFVIEMGGTDATDATDQLDLRMSGSEGGSGQHEIYGRMAVEVVDTGCQFDVRYDTISPLVTENTFTADERVISGEIQVTLKDGGDFNVVIANDVVSVNGVSYTQQQLAAFNADCSLATD